MATFRRKMRKTRTKKLRKRLSKKMNYRKRTLYGGAPQKLAKEELDELSNPSYNRVYVYDLKGFNINKVADKFGYLEGYKIKEDEDNEDNDLISFFIDLTKNDRTEVIKFLRDNFGKLRSVEVYDF
jgi:hypothetical protein